MAKWKKQNLKPKQCSSFPKNTAVQTCSSESVCCDGAPAPLCGSPDSTYCYNAEKTVANLCGKGSSCNPNTGNCFASSLGQFQCGAITCNENSACCDAGFPKAPACVEENTALVVTIQLQRLQISTEKVLSAMCSEGTDMQVKNLSNKARLSNSWRKKVFEFMKCRLQPPMILKGSFRAVEL